MIVEAGGPGGGFARALVVSHLELRLGPDLQGDDRSRVFREDAAQEAHRTRGVAGEKTLAGLGHLGTLCRARRALVDRLDEALGQSEHVAVLLVAELRAFVPGAVGFDHAPVVSVIVSAWAAGQASYEGHAAAERPAPADQGTTSTRPSTFGVAPPLRKLLGASPRAAVALLDEADPRRAGSSRAP